MPRLKRHLWEAPADNFSERDLWSDEVTLEVTPEVKGQADSCR